MISLSQLREFEESCLGLGDSNFLEQQFTKHTISGINRYSLGLDTMYTPVGKNPSAPLFHTYGVLASNALFFAKIPNLYFDGLPDSIKSNLRTLNIDKLDIYFVPQSYVEYGGPTLQIKPTYWLFPDTPAPIPDGNYESGNVIVGVFESTKHKLTIDGSENMIEKTYSLHDGRVSPDHGNINLTNKDLPIAFWSIVFHKETKKCAVTLHWILNFEDNKKIRDDIIQAGNNTIGRLIEEFKKVEPYRSLVNTLNFLN